jgi:hypothetical protein
MMFTALFDWKGTFGLVGTLQSWLERYNPGWTVPMALGTFKASYGMINAIFFPEIHRHDSNLKDRNRIFAARLSC